MLMLLLGRLGQVSPRLQAMTVVAYLIALGYLLVWGLPPLTVSPLWQWVLTLVWLEGAAAAIAPALDDLLYFDIARVLRQASLKDWVSYGFYFAAIPMLFTWPATGLAAFIVCAPAPLIGRFLRWLHTPTPPVNKKD